MTRVGSQRHGIKMHFAGVTDELKLQFQLIQETSRQQSG
jgi:hypothetical protein